MTCCSHTVLLLLAYLAVVIPASADEVPRVKIEFRRAETKPAEGLTEAAVAGTKNKVYLHKAAEVTNADIAETNYKVDNFGELAVEVVFTKEGAMKMATLSEEHKDKPLAILMDGNVISAPFVRAKLSDRSLITGLSKEEASKIVKGFRGK